MTTKEQEEVQGKFHIARRLDSEAVAEHRKRLGVKFNTLGWMRGPNQWVHWDRVNAFTKSMGDRNPLYHDEEYAKKSPYGTVVAPPQFTMSVWRGMLIQGLPGVQIMMGGIDFEFLLPALEGDKIKAECVFARLKEKGSKFSDLWLIEEWDAKFENQHGNLITKQTSYALRWDRATIAEGIERATTAATATFPYPWTEEELKALEDEQIDKPIQGSKPLFWEDVNVGDQLPDLVRGPHRILDAVATATSQDIFLSGPFGLEFIRRKHPGYAFLHPSTRAHEHIEVVHWDIPIAKYLGYPYPYDYGHARQCWVINSATDWMGDHAWLKRNSCRYRKMVFLSDVIRIKSKVTKKYVDENGEHCVDIVHNGWNQRQEDVIPGESTVVLPSREKNRWPVPERLARRAPGQQP